MGHFDEAVNNYHKHHFDINKQREAKGLRSWATDAIGITQMYKQLVLESKRQETKQTTEEYLTQLVDNFVVEFAQHASKLRDVFDKNRALITCWACPGHKNPCQPVTKHRSKEAVTCTR